MADISNSIKEDLNIDALLYYLDHSVNLLITGYPAQTQIVDRINNLTEMLEKDHNYPVEEFIDINIILRGIHDENF